MAFFERELGGKCLEYASYDSATQIMILWFQDGTVYDYTSVELEMYNLFESETAWGITFNTVMRPALHSYTKE